MAATGGLLAIFAHPDDESLVSGAMAKYADAGRPVTVVCATRGEVGEIAEGTGATPETLGQFREQELRDAMAIVGVTDVRFLDVRDSGMQGTPENEDPRSLNKATAERVIEPLVRVVREVRPGAIITWDETGGYGHPDHMAVHRYATAAFHAAADAAQYSDLGATWQPGGLFYSIIPMSEFGAVMEEMRRRGIDVGDPPGDVEAMQALTPVAPNCIIDVNDQYDRKQRALTAHRTQLGSMGAFADMPEDLLRRVFGREFYHRAAPPVPEGVILHDLFDER